MTLHLTVLPDVLAVCRLTPDPHAMPWLPAQGFLSMTWTGDELSIVCAAESVPDDVRQEGPWRAFRVAGPLDFALTGILASLATPLAAAGISIFAVSTFDTDFLLVRADRLDDAVAALTDAGHTVADRPHAP